MKASPLPTEQLTSLLLDALKALGANPSANLSFTNCVSAVDHLLALQLGKEIEYQRGEHFLGDVDERNLKHLVWDLILNRVLVPGHDSAGSNTGWPFLSLTDHGLNVLAESRPVPYDPDKYLDRIRRDSPNIHSTAIRYLQESLATFRAGTYLASAVMLGAASEWVFCQLCTSMAAAMADAAKRKSFEDKVNSRKMRDRINAVTGWCRNHKAQLTGKWAGDEEVEVIDQLAHFIRKRRNETGHPQDRPAEPTHEQMYAWLVVFPEYCRSLYQLKSDLDGRAGSL